VTSRLIGSTGYLRIVSFRDGIADELRKQAAELSKNGAKALIVDVRRTAEGAFENGIAAARVFVKSGTLAIKTGRGKPEPREPVSARAGDGAIDLPTAVLQSTGTAGPGELFVAALNDNNRAELIGERTLGRAGLQKLVKLPEGRGLWLTYARYITPNGNPIQGRGVEPDLAVDEPDVEFGTVAPTTDPILDAALERIKVKIAA
jgi:carboxyl-terminal processing protease